MEDLRIGEVVCYWWAVYLQCRVLSMKYAGVFIVGMCLFFFHWAAESRLCASTGKKGETRVRG